MLPLVIRVHLEDHPGVQIIVEALVALVLAVVGATVRSPALREVTWRSEMKRRYVSPTYISPTMSSRGIS